MDCIVLGVAKSQTWLSNFHFTVDLRCFPEHHLFPLCLARGKCSQLHPISLLLLSPSSLALNSLLLSLSIAPASPTSFICVSCLELLGPLLPRLTSSILHGLARLWFLDMSRTWSRPLRSRCPRVFCAHLYTCGWDCHRSPWHPEGMGWDQRPTEPAWPLGMVLTEREGALHGTLEQEWARVGISTSCLWSTV